MDLNLVRNDNYAPEDRRANYFLMADHDCIGGIDVTQDLKLVADIHIPSLINEKGDIDDPENWTDVTIVCTRQYRSEEDLIAVKNALLLYAEMAICSSWIKPRTWVQLHGT